jgi:hypothetical protein
VAHGDHTPDLGQPLGIATLGADGKVLSAQLPPGLSGHPVTIETRDPVATDDTTLGFDQGDHWINVSTTPSRAWQATGVAAGAATWIRVSNLKSMAVGTDPGVGNDNTQGYEIGSWWINTTTGRSFVAVSVATGAAVWVRASNRKDNIAVLDPTTANDSTQGYEVFSRWVNSVTRESFTCIDPNPGLAIWRQDSNVPGAGKQTPKEHFLDQNLLDYGEVGAHPLGSQTIQYTRVWLTAGLMLDRIRIFIDSGGSNNRYVRAGLYSQTDVLDASLGPSSRLEQSAQLGTGGATGYRDLMLGSTVTITTTGYYWIALVASSTSIKFTLTGTVYRADLLPRRSEDTSGTTLPATASGLTNPQADVAYASAVEP